MNLLSVYRKLVAVNVLNENTNPSLVRLYKDDANYVKTTIDIVLRQLNYKSNGQYSYFYEA